jgi:hypothetical protein
MSSNEAPGTAATDDAAANDDGLQDDGTEDLTEGGRDIVND